MARDPEQLRADEEALKAAMAAAGGIDLDEWAARLLTVRDLAAARVIMRDVKHPFWTQAYLTIQDHYIRGGDEVKEFYEVLRIQGGEDDEQNEDQAVEDQQ